MQKSYDSLNYEEIKNIWTEAIRKLDTQVWPFNGSCPRTAIIDFFDSIQYDMFKRIEMKVQNDLKRNGPRKNSVAGSLGGDLTGPDTDPQPAGRGLSDWKQRTAMGRLHNLEGSSQNDGRNIVGK